MPLSVAIPSVSPAVAVVAPYYYQVCPRQSAQVGHTYPNCHRGIPMKIIICGKIPSLGRMVQSFRSYHPAATSMSLILSELGFWAARGGYSDWESRITAELVVMYVVDNLAAVYVESEDGGCSRMVEKESDVFEKVEFGAIATQSQYQGLMESVGRDGRSVVFVVDLDRIEAVGRSIGTSQEVGSTSDEARRSL